MYTRQAPSARLGRCFNFAEMRVRLLSLHFTFSPKIVPEMLRHLAEDDEGSAIVVPFSKILDVGGSLITLQSQ